MGTYINPGNAGFERILRRRYVDKTGLIALVNDVVNTAEAFVCVTRPRRFGKSFAAQSLELKWNKPVSAAIDQIRRNDYPALLRNLGIPIILAGITYDVDTKEHVCSIETLCPQCSQRVAPKSWISMSAVSPDAFIAAITRKTARI